MRRSDSPPMQVTATGHQQADGRDAKQHPRQTFRLHGRQYAKAQEKRRSPKKAGDAGGEFCFHAGKDTGNAGKEKWADSVARFGPDPTCDCLDHRD